jgi:PAS domain S-box-containing protein
MGGFSDNDRKENLRNLIKKLHEGTKADEVKKEFEEAFKDVSSEEIAKVEEELIKEGMPREEIFKLCDVHMAVIKDSMGNEKTEAPGGHPVNILMEEHKMLLHFASELKMMASKIKGAKDLDSAKGPMEHLGHLVEHFKESETHYLREENVLFPTLEKHGITEPPKVMWMEHDKIREIKKDLYKIHDNYENMDFKDFARRLEVVSNAINEMLSNHFFKENNILFPASMKAIQEGEWKGLRRQFDEIGYCCFTPEPPKIESEEEATPAAALKTAGIINFMTGALTEEMVETMFNTLPAEVTFIDAEDTVRYFSDAKDKIFMRTEAVLGTKVQNCHPQKSLHIVNQILDEFKSGKRDVAEFWITMNERFIHIRYFPVRNKKGEYLGCMEVAQDVTDIKKLEGEKRLL